MLSGMGYRNELLAYTIVSAGGDANARGEEVPRGW